MPTKSKENIIIDLNDYKTRNYNSPIDIGKISIRMLTMDGILVDLHSVDFSFVLQVTTICDNMVPYKTNAVSII